MGKLRLNLLIIVLVGLSPVLSYGGAEEIPQPSEGICYKVLYEANFNELIKLRPHDYSSKISEVDPKSRTVFLMDDCLPLPSNEFGSG